MLAIRTARISTASRPSRKTITAVFVTTAAVERGPAPIALLGVAQRLVERLARRLHLGRRGVPLDQLHEPGVVARAVPEQALDLRRTGRWRGRAGAARARARRPRTPRAAPAPRRVYWPAASAPSMRSRPAEMTSKSAVESAFFHSGGKIASARSRMRSAWAFTQLGVGHLAAARRVGQLAPQRQELSSEPPRRGRIALRQHGLAGRERPGGAVAERDRLLDLEVERHPPVVHAASVLDRHEADEAASAGPPGAAAPRARAGRRGTPRARRAVAAVRP